MDLPHEDVEEIGMDKFTTENIKEYFTISKVSLPNDEMIEYIHNITNGNALLISLFPKIHKDFDSDWGKLDKEEIERVMLEDEEHGLLFYLTDRVFSHIDKSLEIYKLVIPRVLNRGIERILYSDIKVFDEMVESGLMYKGRGRSFERFELHDSVKSAIKANNKRTMGLHFSSHHDDPKISTIHTQMIEYYQTHRLEKNINKDLEICYHSMLLRKDFERNFDKDREEFVELVFGSLYLNTDDKNNICKNFDGFISEQISKLISVFYKDRDRLLNMISPQLYSRLKLETERGMEDVLRDIRFLISLTKERAFKNDSSLYYLIGEIYCEKDEYDKAIEFYSQAIELNPKYDSAYYDMGNAYYNLKEYDNAITAYQKAIDINLKYADVYNNMGLAYDELKEYDNAIEAYQKAIDINTQDYKAYSNMGLTYYNLKEYDKAIEAYQKAIEINPKFTEVSCHMGNAYDKLKEYDKAIKAYQKAIKINPKNDYAYYNMGNAYDKLKEYDKAITAYEKAIEINPKERVAYTNLFELELMRNQDFSFEEHFLGYCGEDKDAMMRYQMLKILQMIATNKPYDLTAELWSEKYRDIELNWGWDEINGWLENMPDGEIKAKLVEEIEVFKAHKRY
jgi:tetratricopeptide (TPR) repeat protein